MNATPEVPVTNVLQDGTLIVLPDQCKFAADRRSAVITVTSEIQMFPDAIAELSSIKARNLAMGYAAANGVGNVCMNDNLIGPYPVNADGVPLDMVAQKEGQDLPPTHPKMQVAGYRIEVKVCTKF